MGAALSERDVESLVVEDLVERHAAEGAFLWDQRDRAARSPAFDLPMLARLDDRLAAHLDGLCEAGTRGVDAATAALRTDLVGAAPTAGSVFVATAIALLRNDVHALAVGLARARGFPDLARGAISALGWLPFERVSQVLRELSDASAAPELQRIGIGGAAAHRHDPGAPLVRALASEDLSLRARGLRTTGMLGRGDLIAALRRDLESADEACRFWAAWSAALFGDSVAAEVLWTFADRGGPFAARACDMAARHTPPKVACDRLSALLAKPGREAIGLRGAAALGDVALVPAILALIDVPRAARGAGAALAAITGVDLAAQKLAGPAPRGGSNAPGRLEEDQTPTLDMALPWPDGERVRAWWARRQRRWTSHVRVSQGKPLEVDWLFHVLRTGKQAAREGAALEIAARGATLFEVRAPAFRQRRRLANLGA